MKKLYFLLSLSLITFSCNQADVSTPIYLIPNKDSTSLEYKFDIDDDCIGDQYFFDNIPIYFYSVELKTPLDFENKISLFFDQKQVEFQECKGLISRYDIPKTEEGKEIDISLKVSGYEYNCKVPSYAFEGVKFLSFNLNFSNEEKCCNETYFGNNKMETVFRISGKYAMIDKKKERCSSKNIQTLEIVKEYGLGSYHEDLIEYYDTFEGRYKKFNGIFRSTLNAEEDIHFHLKDSAHMDIKIYRNEKLLRLEEGEWIYRADRNIINMNTKEVIRMIQGKDTINLKNYALKVNEVDSLALGLMTFRMGENKIEPFELLNLKKSKAL